MARLCFCISLSGYTIFAKNGCKKVVFAGRAIIAVLSMSVCFRCAADTYIGVRVEYMPNRVLIKFDIMRSCLIGTLTVFGSFLHRGISSAA